MTTSWDLPAKQQQDFIWDKIICANPTKLKETLQALDQINTSRSSLTTTRWS